MSEALTFGAIRELNRKEQREPQLQFLQPDFYAQLSSYVSGKYRAIEEAKSRGSEFSSEILEQHEKEMHNARVAIKNLYDTRVKKILLLAWESASFDSIVDISPMTREEREIFDAAYALVKGSKDRTVRDIFTKKEIAALEPVKTEVKEAKVRVKMLEAIQAFVGADLQTYGPYAAGEDVSLPEKNAGLLVEKGKAAKL